MSVFTRSVFLYPVALCAVLLVPPPAQAQSSCTWTQGETPGIQVISCASTLSVEREAGAEITIMERTGNAPPRMIEIEGGAILIDVVPGSAPTQIRTPHAVAAVRGTTYIVDAGADRTSVFVLQGAVNVSSANGSGNTVTLSAGEGADVAAGSAILTARWGDARVRTLLARFGR